MATIKTSARGLRRGVVAAILLSSACFDREAEAKSEGESGQSALTTSQIKYVFVIPFENHDAAAIYGNMRDAPYINGTLAPAYARASNFADELPTLPSEPHYVWMEAGTNKFSDRTFTTDAAPSATNSTASTSHLATQIKNATNGVSWTSYQEGINATTGACPIGNSGFYRPKHNPFVFFRDVSGNPPSKTNAACAARHKPLSALAADLEAGTVASYNFITPNLCHDMHGASACPRGNLVKAGDDWLKANLPAIIQFANSHAGVVFITWDEGANTTKVPFFAIGPSVKVGHVGGVSYDHSSLVKSIERILGLPVLSTVSAASDLADLFKAGSFP